MLKCMTARVAGFIVSTPSVTRYVKINRNGSTMPISAAKCSCRQENRNDSFKFSSPSKKGIIFNFITVKSKSKRV